MCKKRSFYFWKTLKNRRGFTLTEVVVTLSILGIMAAISVPSYFSWLPRHRLQTSARQIYDDLNLVKIQAVKDNGNACIQFYPATDTYTVYIDVDGVTGYTAGVDTLIKGNVALEKDVNITGTSLTSDTCGFNNRGLLPSGILPAIVQGQVSLTNPTTDVLRVDVNAAGGIRIL
jgi:prepilin-type N-terminal cleavage/methylation domain-containing protein